MFKLSQRILKRVDKKVRKIGTKNSESFPYLLDNDS